MNRKPSLLALAAATVFPAFANAEDIDWKKVDAALGKTAAVTGEVHRYGLPRSDLHVPLDGVTIKPALALGGWVDDAMKLARGIRAVLDKSAVATTE
jgi:hypothetical protein